MQPGPALKVISGGCRLRAAVIKRTPQCETEVGCLRSNDNVPDCNNPPILCCDRSALLAGVSRLKLVSNGKNEDDVFGREPTVLRDVPVTAAREDELASPLFSGPSEERMISQKLKSLSHAQNLFTRLSGILGGDEVKEPFEVSKRFLSYFDRRHARALGRRALAPDARAAR